MKNLNCDLKIAGFRSLSIRDTLYKKDSKNCEGQGNGRIFLSIVRTVGREVKCQNRRISGTLRLSTRLQRNRAGAHLSLIGGMFPAKL